MSLQHDHDYDEVNFNNEISTEDSGEELAHKKQVRKLLEEKLARKRLKEEFDELDGEFDWDNVDY